MKPIKLELKKQFSVPAEMIYDAWLDPESVKIWMYPGEGVSVPNPEIDARVGGKFQFDMEIGGDNRLPHFGEYKVLEKPHKIQFTWNSANTENQDTLVTISIEPIDSQSCQLQLVHELFRTEEAKNDHQGGWTNILETLGRKISR